MSVKEMTAREMRNINPTKEMLVEAVDYLFELGWDIRPDKQNTRIDWACWWINPNHPTKYRPVGDSKNLHFGAWDTLKTYVAKENNQ